MGNVHAPPQQAGLKTQPTYPAQNQPASISSTPSEDRRLPEKRIPKDHPQHVNGTEDDNLRRDSMAQRYNQPTLADIRRDLDHEIRQIQEKDRNHTVTPEQYTLALDEATKGFWSVQYEHKLNINLDYMPLVLLVAIFTMGIGLLLLALVSDFNLFVTHATLQVHAQETTITRTGSSDVSDNEGQTHALAEAIKTLLPTHAEETTEE